MARVPVGGQPCLWTQSQQRQAPRVAEHLPPSPRTLLAGLGQSHPRSWPRQLREALGPARDVVRPNSTLSLPPLGQARGTCWAAAPVPPQPAVLRLPGSPDISSGPVPAPSEGSPARVPSLPSRNQHVPACLCLSGACPNHGGHIKGVLLLPVPTAHSPSPWPGLTGSLLRCCLQGPQPPGRSCRSCLQWGVVVGRGKGSGEAVMHRGCPAAA